jgi:hypothetical protein
MESDADAAKLRGEAVAAIGRAADENRPSQYVPMPSRRHLGSRKVRRMQGHWHRLGIVGFAGWSVNPIGFDLGPFLSINLRTF